MTKESYLIRLISPRRYTFIGLLLFLVVFGVLWFLHQQDLFPESRWIGLAVVIGSIASAYYLVLRHSRAEVKLRLDQEGLHLAWLKQFSFSHRSDFLIRWADIEEYKFEHLRWRQLFMLTLKDGTVFRLYKDMETLKTDDFSAFRAAFIGRVEQYNQHLDEAIRIQQRQSFIETRLAFVVAILLTTLIAAFPIVLVVLYLNHSSLSVPVGIMGAVSSVPALLFVYIVYEKRKKSD